MSSPDTSDDLRWASAWQIAELVRDRAVSVPEVARAFLARALEVDRVLNSFITIAEDRFRAAADEVQRAVERGDELGPFAGVPYSAKDNIFTAGVRTTIGSLLFDSFVPAEDAPMIRRLDAAGGLLLGKANLPEFSAWGRSVNRVSTECRNPWDLARTCGASSGGSGAAVAAGLVPLSIGTDDGGSIRLPAALNGVFGFFPSARRVSLEGVVVVGGASRAGPLSRDVRDAAMFLDAVAVDPADAGFAARLDAGVPGVRMAWLEDHETLPSTDGRVVDAVRTAAMQFGDAGATVDRPSVTLLDAWGAAPPEPFEASAEVVGLRVTELEGFLAATADPAWRSRLSPYIDAQRYDGSVVVDPSEQERLRARGRAVLAQLEELFSSYDLLLCPTIDQIAPIVSDDLGYPYGPAGTSTTDSRRIYVKFTQRANLGGFPAAAVPCGFVDGMPVSLHIMGRPGEDLLVLQASRAFEILQPWKAFVAATVR